VEPKARSPSSGAGLVSEVVRLSAHTAWDRVRRPVPLVREDIPHCVEAITREWLTAVLCADAPGVRVEAIDAGAVSAGSSVRRRLQLTWSSADAARAAGLPSSVFVKTSGRLLNRLMLGLSRTIEIEVQAYRHVRPQLDVEAPRCLHAGYDLRSGRQVVVLEDLVATKGARFGSPDMAVSREQAEQMVDWLAALHRRFAGREDLARAFPWLKTYPEWFHDGHERWGLRRYHDQALIEAADVIPARLRDRGAEIWPAQVRSLAVHAVAPTVQHGDVHVGNWYVTGEGRMGLCDWQCLCIGHGLRDVAYALSTALTIDDRRAWERELVRRYVDAVGGTTFDAAFATYRQQLIAALLMWTPTLCHSPIMPDMQPRPVSLALIGRIATAMDDLESLDAG
jgi:hypothetical protein